MELVIKDFKVIHERDANIPLKHAEYFNCFTVYESLKVVNGKVFFVREHIERLFHSCSLIGLEHDFTAEAIEESIVKLVEVNNVRKALIKMEIIGGTPPCIFIYCSPYPEYTDEYYTEGVKVITVPGKRYFAEAKTKNLLLNFLSLRKAREASALEAVFMDENRNLLEGTRTNIFFIRGTVLLTPDTDVLKGITRQHILNIAGSLGFSIQPGPVRLESVYNGDFDEIFISSTSMGAMPVSRIDDYMMPDKIKYTIEINRALKSIYES